MKKFIKALFFLTLCLTIVVPVIAADTKYNQLTVYTALPDSEVPVYFNAFEKDTGIKVNYIRLSAGEILARLQAEKNNPQASVFHGGSTDNFIAAIDMGLLDKYVSPESKTSPPHSWTKKDIGRHSISAP